MKYIDRRKVAVPEILQGQAAPTSGPDVQECIYGHTDVKNALNQLQHGICCYCESRYDVTGYGEVEHFRPKNGWQQDKEDKHLHQPGYYWLAYKWENLMYACKRCNCKYKQNYFPLKDPTKRFKPETRDISEEIPLLINPYEEQHPEWHLRFDGTSIRALTEKGDASIEYYGLDREELNEVRRGVYNDINAFVDILDIAHSQGVDIGPIKDKLKERVVEKIAEGQHTLMIKCNFGKYL
jgi:uncharacterized protein (TIGR02646 family)